MQHSLQVIPVNRWCDLYWSVILLIKLILIIGGHGKIWYMILISQHPKWGDLSCIFIKQSSIRSDVAIDKPPSINWPHLRMGCGPSLMASNTGSAFALLLYAYLCRSPPSPSLSPFDFSIYNQQLLLITNSSWSINHYAVSIVNIFLAWKNQPLFYDSLSN